MSHDLPLRLRHKILPTLIFLSPGPSSFKICSFACLGRSTVFVLALRFPNRNDIVAAGMAIVMEAQRAVEAVEK